MNESLSVEERKILAKRVIAAFDAWNLTPKERLLALDLRRRSYGTLRRYRAGRPVGVKIDRLERIRHLLAISKLLKNAAWIKTPCAAFDGKRPVDLMQSFVGLYNIRRFLEKKEMI